MTKNKKKTPTKPAARPKTPPARKAPPPAAPKAKPTPAAAPKAAPTTAKPRDPRLPAAGTTIEKTYKGKALKVEVLEAGFRFDGRDWSSLTAIAMAVTGAKSINGPLFFGIATRAPKPTGEAK